MPSVVICLACVQTVATATRVTHARTGQAERIDDLSNGIEIARRFSVRRFRLEHSAPHTATLHEATATEPANCVDPFWACERTNLPQTEGVASRWFWPKALTGNTHPGASLPHGFVSVSAYSGAYPTGYGLNHQSSGAEPSSLFGGDYADPATPFSEFAYQYGASGFAHFQPSGTGSIGNYYNFLKVAPLRLANATAFAPPLPRSTLVGERATAGLYSATLGEMGARAQVTTADGVALHRYTFAPHGGQLALGVELTAAGLAIPHGKQAIEKVQATIAQAAVNATGGRTIEGMVLTPGPVGGGAGGGLELFFSIELRGATALGFWPPSLNASAATGTIDLNATQLDALGSVGVIARLDGGNASAEVRVGLSFHGPGAARGNRERVGSASFDEVADAAWRAWNDALSRVAVQDDASTPGAMVARRMLYSTLFHALRKPVDATGHVPDDWGGGAGFVFDLSTMWDQYKTTLPLILSVYPQTGSRLLNGLLALARRFGIFPTGYTMDTDASRFSGQVPASRRTRRARAFSLCAGDGRRSRSRTTRSPTGSTAM